MKTLKLKHELIEYMFDANECLRLGCDDVSGVPTDWEVLVLDGCIWLSFASMSGKHSATPLTDVVLRAGQSYRLTKAALRRGAIVSTFEKSTGRFFANSDVLSRNGK
jgi:hypothetical protein